MRRTVVALLVLTGVAVGGFGLGYLLGHKGPSPGPSAVQTPTPRAVLVPKVLHLSMSDGVHALMNVDLTVGKVEIRTGGEPGTIVAQFPPPGTSAAPGSPVNLFVSTSVYPRGAFEWCPEIRGTLPVGPGLRQEAEQVALRFSQGFLMGDGRTVRRLLDPAALPLQKNLWTIAGKPRRLKVGAFGVHGRPLVPYGCGKDVASRTVVVVVDDGTTSASADFNLYLVRRADGLKVWASY
jgi:PASTA domain